MTDSLEQNSRTIREKRRGNVEQFTAIVAACVGIGTAASGAHWIAQVIVFSVIGVIALSSWSRFFRIGQYRRQDHKSGKNRKPGDL